jgi:CRP-like cAMP-binding protein
MQKHPFSTQMVLRKQLSHFQPEVLERIQATAPRRQLEAGAYLFRQGELGSSMYIVISGRLSPTRPEKRKSSAKLCRATGLASCHC